MCSATIQAAANRASTDHDVRLPGRDALGFTNVLLCALGGEGANTIAKLLFQVAIEELGLDGAYDARYGSEKTGTPTDVSLRLCARGVPVRECGPTVRPHVLAIFHQSLVEPLGLLAGFQSGGVLLVDGTDAPEVIAERLQVPRCEIVVVDARGIARATGSRANVPFGAALAEALGLPAAQVRKAIEHAWPRARERNLAAFDQALAGLRRARIDTDLGPERPPRRTGPTVGWQEMHLGGAIRARDSLTSLRPALRPARGAMPTYDAALCSGCTLCLYACSDPGAIVWDGRRVVGLDETLCKACNRCVEVCPATKRGRALEYAAAPA